MKFRTRDWILFAETFCAIILMEIVFRGFTLGFEPNGYLKTEICITILISLAVAGVFFFVRTLIPGKGGKIAYLILMGAATFMFAAQTVYYAIFETFFTTYSMLNSAQVIEFQDVIWANIWEEKLPILILFAICGLSVTLMWREKKRDEDEKGDSKNKIILLAMAAVICFVTSVGAFTVSHREDENPASPYQNLYTIGEIQGSVRCSGLMGAMGIDLWRLVFGFEPDIEEKQAFAETKSDDNVIEGLDLKALAEEEKDPVISSMHSYFGSTEPTEKNSKTGIFEGKNLIFITAESFTDFAVDPVHTPTLYKLQTEGYTFDNFYNPIWGVSTLDGEYVNLQGLVPKPGVWSMKESSSNYLPLTLGHRFENLGYATKAYHNHSIYYYDRNLSHPNLGYDFKGQGREYSFEDTWPESDLEMIDKTVSDFLTPDENGEIQPFHVYYLTVSGHMNYNFYTNDMAIKNREAVQDMDLSENCKAYVAANIELDKAIELLIERLDEAGELENTVIAIAGDHYPYGLGAENISEFKGHDVDTAYEMYESTFLLWTLGMEPEHTDKICSNMDILPTLSNMFGIEYDSRLLVGKDIFSDSEGFVLFKDKNWISEKGTRASLVGADDEYVKAMDKKAMEMFNYSALVLEKDYYSYLKDYIE